MAFIIEDKLFREALDVHDCGPSQLLQPFFVKLLTSFSSDAPALAVIAQLFLNDAAI